MCIHSYTLFAREESTIVLQHDVSNPSLALRARPPQALFV